MHRAKQAWKWIKLLAAELSRQIRPLIIKVGMRAKSSPPRDLIRLLGTLVGTVALGWWRQSFAAALFGGIGLFFLSSIFKTSEQMLAAVQQSEREPLFGSVDAYAATDPGQKNNSDALNQAIGRLKPWLQNEVSLTEEDAKDCCAAILDSVAVRSRAAANRS